MTEEEIRTEITRRKKVASEMKLSNRIWSLYNSTFQYIDDKLKKDPGLILPEIRQSLKQSGDSFEFKFKNITYNLDCDKGKDEEDGLGRDSTTTPMSFSLRVRDNLVYEFHMRRTITYGYDSPSFYETFGSINAFIEGPWMADIDQLQAAISDHSQQVYKERNAPRVKAQLQQDMRKFGL